MSTSQSSGIPGRLDLPDLPGRGAGVAGRGAGVSERGAGAAPPSVRIGVAFDIPEPWGGDLTRRRLRAGDPQATHVPAHLTLLGPTDVDPAALSAIEGHLATVARQYRPYLLHLRGTGTFRPVTDVVFVAVAKGIGECEQLAAAIGEAPALHREMRYPYHPHVTVAQDVPAAALDEVYEDLADFSARLRVDHFTLFEHSGDGRWKPRRDFPLAGTSSAGGGSSAGESAPAAG